MATKPKRPVKYDLKAADRKRNLAIQIGLTAAVVIFAVVLVLVIVMKSEKVDPGESRAVRVAAEKVITKDGTTEPKAVLSLYEDFQCPHCRDFEQAFGPTITSLVTNGVMAADYYMVAILDTPTNKNYSTRAASAAYCVADEDKSPNKIVFSRFHAALFAQQPPEGAPAPDDAGLISTARLAGAGGTVPDCVNSGKYADMVGKLAETSKITATPTLRLNGEDISVQTPAELIAKVKEIVGDVPGLDAPAAPAPAAPPAPAPAAAPPAS